MQILDCDKLNGWISTRTKEEIVSNLKENLFFLISGIAFWGLYLVPNVVSVVSLFCSVFFIALISFQISSIWEKVKKSDKRIQLIALVNAMGTCLVGKDLFYKNWHCSSKIKQIEEMLPIEMNLVDMIGIMVAVVAIYFVFTMMLVIWESLIANIKKLNLFSDISVIEKLIYIFLLVVSLGWMIYIFTKTHAFYYNDFGCDVIYTSDSAPLVKRNVYLNLCHPENDLRQPLFAVFASPFVGWASLISKIIGVSVSINAILLNFVQVIMLFFANFMLAKMMELNSIKRICFVLLTSCTYMQLLFILMMEQYIVAYFWLVLCISLIVKNQKVDYVTMCGTGGTLLTNMILMPLMVNKHPFKKMKEWLRETIKYGMLMIAALLMFFRFDVIFNLASKVSQLSRFTGKKVSLEDKLYQYMQFIKNCFISPEAGVNTVTYKHVSWQLDVVTKISVIGIFILVLVIISAVWNRNKKSSLLAAGWVGFSIIMLFGFGWGTQENGLILYSLYFGWAFLVLLFQLAEKIQEKLKLQYMVPIVTIIVVAMLLVINIPAMKALVNFAVSYYPV